MLAITEEFRSEVHTIGVQAALRRALPRSIILWVKMQCSQLWFQWSLPPYLLDGWARLVLGQVTEGFHRPRDLQSELLTLVRACPIRTLVSNDKCQAADLTEYFSPHVLWLLCAIDSKSSKTQPRERSEFRPSTGPDAFLTDCLNFSPS